MPDRKRTRSPSPGGKGREDDDHETMRIMPIGAGNEVGRSCIVVKYMGKTIMLDCGIHPGYNGIAALPFFDAIDPSEIDLLLVTHFHLDHAASLPYLTEKTGFKGRIFCTHPTKAVMRMLLSDYIRLVNVQTEDILYDEKDLNRCIDKIELIDYHQVLEHEGIKFWCYNAGHVLGAAMFMIEIAGIHVLYTGDYSMENDRHLMAAEMPSTSPDVLIVEATYGVQVHEPRKERESRFVAAVSKAVKKGGRCLIPVFALGRAQELLLILDEYWQQHRELHHIPIYYASRLASKAIRVYQTYINMMNEHIRQQMDVANPFKFQHITNLKSIDQFDDSGPSVVMASPGMLQSGVSRMLFDRWCSDDKNCVLIPGYSVEGTLAKKLLTLPEEVSGMDGRVRQRRCDVVYISFSAHVDFVQNKSFIDGVQPANLILVHGEENGMGRLKNELEKQFALLPKDERPPVFNPKNCAEVRIDFHRDTVAKAVGALARELRASRRGSGPAKRREAFDVQGLLVNERFTKRLMAPGDLDEYTTLKVGGVRQRLSVPYFSSAEALHTFVREVFANESIKEENGDFGTRLVVHQSVAATLPPPSAPDRTKLVIEWDASPVNDMLADSIVALAAQAQTSPAGISLTTSGHHHHHKHDSPCGQPQSSASASAMDVDERLPSKTNDKAGDDGGGSLEKSGKGDTAEAAVKTEEGVSEQGHERSRDGASAQMDTKRAHRPEGRFGDKEKPATGVGDKRPEAAVAAEAAPAPSASTAAADADADTPPGKTFGGSASMIRSMALLLIRHAMQDTFGKAAVSVNDKTGEIDISTDGKRARLRISVTRAPESVAEDEGATATATTKGSAAWSCEVIECEKTSLRNQLTLLLDRLRAAVSRT